MKVKEAYNSWADQYDSNINRTRDLEAISLRETIVNIQFETCLEIGCGTGKNTEWLVTKCKEITAVDLSEEMLLKAKEKIKSANVTFQKTDINYEWRFVIYKFDLISFSLVLEHIEYLDSIFRKSSESIIPLVFETTTPFLSFNCHTKRQPCRLRPLTARLISAFKNWLVNW